MQPVRFIEAGERIEDIIDEAKRLTFLNDREYALVKLADGRRAIVTGGRDGIEFAIGEIVRIFGHTHPYSRPATGCASPQDKQALEALGQRSSYILEHGVLFRYTVD